MTGIHINDLSFSYDPHSEILSHLSFSAASHETIGLIGANGTGKSTFLKLLVGLLPSPQGKIIIGDRALEKKTLASIREKIGYVFQDADHQLFMSTAYDDIAFGPQNYGYPPEEVEKRVEKALQMTHMLPYKHTPIYQLSGGQKKLISLATILSLNPEIVLLDEPSITLDPRNRKQLIHILNEMKSLKIIASHDLDLIWDTCERTLLLSNKEIVADGPTKNILQDKALLQKHGLELPLRFYDA